MLTSIRLFTPAAVATAITPLRDENNIEPVKDSDLEKEFAKK
jgi:hypothetical protein